MSNPAFPGPVIGLLGGIASGKSTVAAEWARRGAAIIDVDALGHAALRQRDVKAALVARFGPEILDDAGEIARSRLGARVFQNRADLEFLNQLVHPRMRCEIAQRVEEAFRRGAKAVVIDAALLLEHDLGASLCTHLVYVDAPEAVRRGRAAQQRGWEPEELAKREAFQWPLDRKRRAAHEVLNNDADEETLRRRAAACLDALIGGAPPPEAS